MIGMARTSIPGAARKWRVLLLAAVACQLAACEEPTGSGTWNLIWEDEFDGARGELPDPGRWVFDIGTDWGNAQLEYDTDRASNVSLDGEGNLAITARRESYRGSNFTSGRIKTQRRFERQGGRFEARIKMSAGQGIWPAFWLLGTGIDSVGWPRCGEIDIMEFRGQEPDIIHGSLHGPGYSAGGALTTRYQLDSGGFHDDFHIFAVEWHGDRIDWFVDGVHYQRLTPSDVPGEWVFNTPFFIILNVAVGGHFVGAPNSATVFPNTMLVDWVRVYENHGA